MTDVIVIGGGINGLVAAAWLAKQDLETVLLEGRPSLGGAASSAELAPNFQVPALSHSLGPVHADVIRALRLTQVPGLEFLVPDPALTTLAPDGRLVSFHRDAVLTATSIQGVSAKDATTWRQFVQTAHRLAGVLASLDRHPPPPLDDASFGDWWRLAGAGNRLRALGRRDRARLARWIPMAVADIVTDWFESDLVCAAIAARALVGTFAGPRSAGTGAGLLQRVAEDPVPVGSGITARGGPGALARALAVRAESYRATITTGAPVARIVSKDGRATGVVLEDGKELTARAVVSAVGPKTTLLDLVDPMDLPAAFRERVRHHRARGVTTKINLALSGAPIFPAVAGDPLPLRGRLLIAPGLNYLERAFDAVKYGRVAEEPWLEISVPSILDSSLAPPDRHVMSIYAHGTPPAPSAEEAEAHRDRIYRRVMGVLTPHAPGLDALVIKSDVITPTDLETDWGMAGGHMFHGEMALDQYWIGRPLLGWAQYRTPLECLYLASAGTHPGGGLTGLSGLHAARRVVTDLKASTNA